MAGKPKLVKKRTAKQPLPTLRPAIITDMRKFFARVDWEDWWTHFYTDISPSGTQKWKTVRQFASEPAHCNTPKQIDFVCYACGPANPDKQTSDIPEEFKFVAPMDWLEKRRTGGWYSRDSIRIIAQQIRSKADALEALRESGNAITLNSLIRFDRMAEQLDREFGGQLMVAEMSFAENKARAELYMRLHGELLAMQAKAQDMYAKSHGINFATDTFSQIMATAAMHGALGDGSGGPRNRSNHDKVLGTIISMTLEKATTHAIPIAKEMAETVAAVVQKSKLN